MAQPPPAAAAAVATWRRRRGAPRSVAALGLGLAAAATLLPHAAALDNGLGTRPGLGWNSDYCLNCESPTGSDLGPLRGFQNDAFVRHIADFLVSSGLAALGYVNVNMDAGWDTFARDAAGNLVPDPALWTAPGGMNATIAYVHDRGLKFGLYGDRGSMDCSKRPGQDGHQAADAALFAALGVDWFKMDSCYAPQDQPSALAQYAAMRDALNATGRPIWFALCGWQPWYAPPGQSLGNSWRIGPDTGSGWAAVLANVRAALALGAYAGPAPGGSGGGWNDLSLLLLPGMGSGADAMSRERHRSQFNFHVVLAANMLLTGNLSSIDPYALETWGNAEAVAVNQDPRYVPFVVPPVETTAATVTAALPRLVDAVVAECGGEPALQKWTFNDPAKGFLSNTAAAGAALTCLNAADCGDVVIFDACTTTGGTCAGPGVFTNEQWALAPGGGALTSALPGAPCVTVTPARTLVLAPCASPLPPNQTWAYAAAGGQLVSAADGGGGLCLTAPAPAPPANDTALVVARRLSSGAWAVVLLNDAPANATVTCGAACFTAMGLPPTQLLRVRDLWAHADVNVTPATSLSVHLGPSGESALLTLTPIACAADADCNLNGVCDAVAGTCACDSGWTGPTCAVLDLSLPVTPGQGTCDPSLSGPAVGATSTWGGNPVRDPATGTWHLFPAEMARHCGMAAWGSQSQVGHYTSASLTGPYARVGTAVGPFAHNPVVVPVPPGSGGPNVSFLMLHIGLGCDSDPRSAHACNYAAMPACVNGSTPSGPLPTGSPQPAPPGLARGVAHVAASLDGAWAPSSPDWTLPRCANNPAPVFLPNGSLLLLCHEPMSGGGGGGESEGGGAGPCPLSGGLWITVSLTANWTHGPYSPPGCLNLLSPSLTVGGTTYTAANEDPVVWVNARGHLHVLTHNQSPGYDNTSWFAGDVRGDGGHFFSSDGGASWRFTWAAAYDGLVPYTTGGVRYKRERPKLVVDPGTGAPLALATGVSRDLVDAFAPGGADAACTLVVAVGAAHPQQAGSSH